MKELFITWIIFQLLVIGIATADIKTKVIRRDKSLCTREEVPIWFGAMFPLASFLPEYHELTKLCEN